MIVNLYDSRAPFGNWQYTTPNSNVTRIVAGSNEPLCNVLRRIIEQSQGLRSIWLLRIIAHGNSGEIGLGNVRLNVNNVEQFSVLRNYFSSGGIGIALHACGVASHTSITGEDIHDLVPGSVVVGGGHGVDFLRALSRSTKVNVRGGVNYQEIHPNSDFRFEGPSVVVTPEGSTIAVPDWAGLSRDRTYIIR